MVDNILKINACSGGIYKTYKESFFIQFSLYSEVADVLFKRSYNYCNYKDVVKRYGNLKILQMIICGENEVIAEVIKNEDFNGLFLSEDEECEK